MNLQAERTAGLIACLLGMALAGGCSRPDAPPTSTTSPTSEGPVAQSANADRPAERSTSGLVRPSPPTTDQPDPLDPAKLSGEAMLALESGDLDQAYQLGREAIRIAPDDPQVVFLMASILGQRHRFPEAIRMLEPLAESNPDIRLPVMGQTADWMVRFGQFADAERRYLAILDELPDSALVHRNLARLLLRQGRRVDAVPHLRTLCELGDVTEIELRSLILVLHPFRVDAERDDLDPFGALAKVRKQISKGDWQAARQQLEESDLDSSDEARALLGRVHLKLGDADAVEAWIAGNSTSPQTDADAWFTFGSFAAQKGDHAKAIRCFTECVLRDQTDHQAYSMMGESLSAIDATEEAAEALQRADLIQQTQTQAAELAASDQKDDQKFSILIGQLNELHRPLESLAWRGVQLAYSTRSDAEADSILAEIKKQRLDLLDSNRGWASRRFVLCGVDLDALPGKLIDDDPADSDTPQKETREPAPTQ